jgi:hypothetical protein
VRVKTAWLRGVASVLLWTAFAFLAFGCGFGLLVSGDGAGLQLIWAALAVLWLPVGGGIAVALRYWAERIEERV